MSSLPVGTRRDEVYGVAGRAALPCLARAAAQVASRLRGILRRPRDAVEPFGERTIVARSTAGRAMVNGDRGHRGRIGRAVLAVRRGQRRQAINMIRRRAGRILWCVVGIAGIRRPAPGSAVVLQAVVLQVDVRRTGGAAREPRLIVGMRLRVGPRLTVRNAGHVDSGVVADVLAVLEMLGVVLRGQRRRRAMPRRTASVRVTWQTWYGASWTLVGLPSVRCRAISAGKFITDE